MNTRTAARVERLFQIIKMSCRPVMLGDQRRTGFGLPDVVRAVGLAPALTAPAMNPAMASMMGSGIGSAMGPVMGSPALQSLASLYREQPRMMPQSMNAAMMGDPYAQFRPMMAGMMAMPGNYAYGMW